MKSKNDIEKFEKQAEFNRQKHEFLDEIVRRQLEALQALIDDPKTPAGVRQKAMVDICRIVEKERKRIGSTSAFMLQQRAIFED